MQHYTYTITWDKNEEEYRGTCTEFPSLSHFDYTPEYAFEGILDLVFDCVKDMKSKGKEIPVAIMDR